MSTILCPVVSPDGMIVLTNMLHYKAGSAPRFDIGTLDITLCHPYLNGCGIRPSWARSFRYSGLTAYLSRQLSTSISLRPLLQSCTFLLQRIRA